MREKTSAGSDQNEQGRVGHKKTGGLAARRCCFLRRNVTTKRTQLSRLRTRPASAAKSKGRRLGTSSSRADMATGTRVASRKDSSK